MPCEAEGFRGEKKSGSESKEGSYTTNSGHTEGPHIPMSNVCAANADARQNRATVRSATCRQLMRQELRTPAVTAFYVVVAAAGPPLSVPSVAADGE